MSPWARGRVAVRRGHHRLSRVGVPLPEGKRVTTKRSSTCGLRSGSAPGYVAGRSRPDQEDAMRTVIVGGVAGGMSVATRLRRLDEEHEVRVVARLDPNWPSLSPTSSSAKA